jgi:hypothetical protein
VHLWIEDVFGCNYYTLVLGTVDVLRKHYNIEHVPLRRGLGGQGCSGSRAIRETLECEHFGDQTPWKAVKFQRFFRNRLGSAGFRIKYYMVESLGIEGRINRQTVGEVKERDASTDDVFRRLAMPKLYTPTKTQVSLWPERTRWPNNQSGVSLTEATRLARLPEPEEFVLAGLTSFIN